MKSKVLIIVAVVGAIFAADLALRTETASAGSLILPSATPRKRPRTKPYTAQPDLDANASRTTTSSKARTETVNNNETITIGRKPRTGTAIHRTSNFFGNTDPSHSYGKSHVRRRSGNRITGGRLKTTAAKPRKTH